jgi:soluble lytic murein transglycosylase-like protein
VGAERAISSVRHFAFRSTKSKKISDLELYKILLSIAWHESNFKLKSFGLNGEIGPYQIKPATAVSIAKKYKIRYKSKDSLLDPRISSSIALYLILDYVYEHQRLDEAIKMYNQGPGYKIVHRENKAEEYLKDIKEKIHKLTI